MTTDHTHELLIALRLALQSMERSCRQSGFDPVSDTECSIIRNTIAKVEDAAEQAAVDALIALVMQPEDRPSPSYTSARESALDEQAAEYDDWSVEEEQLHERRMHACDR